MAALELHEVVYVVDENLLRLGKGILAIRYDTARFSESPLAELLPLGIDDPDWIPVVGDNGWILITNDRRIRTRPVEAELAIQHRLKVVHLHGKIRPCTRLGTVDTTDCALGGDREARRSLSDGTVVVAFCPPQLLRRDEV